MVFCWCTSPFHLLPDSFPIAPDQDSNVVLESSRMVVLSDFSISAKASQDNMTSMTMRLSQAISGPSHQATHPLDLVFVPIKYMMIGR